MADLEVSRDGRVATLTLNRPHAKNAVTRGMWADIRDELQTLADDDFVGVVVLTGAGDAFCAGGDVKDMADRLMNPGSVTLEQSTAYIREIVAASRLLHTMPKVTIAAINGAAAGAGLSLALACDLRIMADEAKMTTAFANIALSGDFGGGFFLAKLVGQARARELFYLSPKIDGREAARIGVVNFSCPANTFADELKALSQRIASGPTSIFASMKANFHLAETATLDDYLHVEAKRMAEAFETEDHREAAMAFVAKRKPVFKGR